MSLAIGGGQAPSTLSRTPTGVSCHIINHDVILYFASLFPA